MARSRALLPGTTRPFRSGNCRHERRNPAGGRGFGAGIFPGADLRGGPLGPRGDYFLTHEFPIGPLLQMGFTGDLFQLGLTVQAKYPPVCFLRLRCCLHSSEEVFGDALQERWARRRVPNRGCGTFWIPGDGIPVFWGRVQSPVKMFREEVRRSGDGPGPPCRRRENTFSSVVEEVSCLPRLRFS